MNRDVMLHNAASAAASGNRYYASISPPFAHEPTRDRVRVISTADGKGEGLQAMVDFSAGEVVFTFTGSVVTEQTLYTLQIEPGKYLSDPIVMGKVLHACDPNMSCDMRTLTFTARRDIKAGDMLTMDYETTEDELFRSFYCGCGASSCRGWIRGRLVR
ncbi:SET domain-containing protein-lysine N-methyltransferase [Permianibacter sp. IMCC34836]|uniref:SET domain-containing protein-lysine N-methyltransferase n=1 Tax=Permianibacter fluminis TaxID=2738515 RepID=UPI001554A09C|nr:SET domain-containing protein-lysine N-methyltransferase [Permianibacter fluminis]NQD36976.1 SET domain-containing protein-lysine N-methyltransferase [Permianibacter fluminis]